jgi:hypothetical protein
VCVVLILLLKPLVYSQFEGLFLLPWAFHLLQLVLLLLETAPLASLPQFFVQERPHRAMLVLLPEQQLVLD